MYPNVETDADTEAPLAPVSETHPLCGPAGVVAVNSAAAEIPPMFTFSPPIEHAPPTASQVAATSPAVNPCQNTSMPEQISMISSQIETTTSHSNAYVENDRVHEYALGRVPLATPVDRPRRQIRRPWRYRE